MEQAIVLGRIGHYFNSGNGSCSTALIVNTFGDSDKGDLITGVNVAGWTHDGDAFSRTSVPVVPNASTADTQSSFHLNRNCPWSR